METISAEDAQEIVYAGPIAREEVSQHRWYQKQLIVFELEGRLMGFHYLEPASELQEDQDRFESDPVELFPVVGRENTVIVYERASGS